MTHATDAYTDPYGVRDCVGMEVRALRAEVLAHSSIWRDKEAPMRTPLERGHNGLAAYYLSHGDPGLYRLVADNAAYQSQCDLWVP